MHISCLFLPVHSTYDRYSLSSKNYEPHAFYRRHFWCFPHLERRIYTHLVCFCQRTLATIDSPYEARIMNRTRFIESISAVFPHLERRICTHILSVSASALALDCTLKLFTKNIHILSVAASALLLRSILIPFEFVTNRTLFIETITCVFPHLERRIYTFIT